jgi:hypothetical protein
MEDWNTTKNRTMEHATLLWSLQEVPERPVENTMPVIEGHWSLPMIRERQLADDFAFISSFRDASDEVMAVCVEESEAGASLTIRVASNVGVGEHAVQELQGVADVMLQSRSRGKYEAPHTFLFGVAKQSVAKSRAQMRSQLLTKIVAMSRQRILAPLRSKHAKKNWKIASKQTLLSGMRRAIHESS